MRAPLNPLDEKARTLLCQMMSELRFAALGVIDPQTQAPHLSRVAVQQGPDGMPLALLSGLAAHSRALLADHKAGLLIEASQPKGDPMTHPRLSLQCLATPMALTPALRARWLAAHPRAQVFIDLPDFRPWQLRVQSGLLNAGFGKAYPVGPADMPIPPAA